MPRTRLDLREAAAVNRGRFDGLLAYLLAARQPVVRLDFAQLDELVAGGLPESARTHQAWWSNRRTGQPHARYWLDAGRRADVDLASGTVVFVRVDGRPEPARDSGTACAGGRDPAEGSDSARRHPAPIDVAATELTVLRATAAELRFEWVPVGSVRGRDDGASAELPGLPGSAGVYRLRARNGSGQQRFLIGYASDLGRLGADGLGELVDEFLGEGTVADLAVVLRASFGDVPLDLSNEADRRLVFAACEIELRPLGNVRSAEP